MSDLAARIKALCDDPGGPDSWTHTFDGKPSVFVDDVLAVLAESAAEPLDDAIRAQTLLYAARDFDRDLIHGRVDCCDMVAWLIERANELDPEDAP